MFTNYIYIIIVLLAYGSYKVPENLDLSGFSILIEFFLSSFLFVLIIHLSFRYLKKKRNIYSFHILDKRFNALVSLLSVSAILFFIYAVYGLHIKFAVSSFVLFKYLPALLDLSIVSIFFIYICTVWAFSWETYTYLMHNTLSRREYIRSNLMFIFPVIIIWFLITLIPNVIDLLPFKSVSNFLESNTGYQVYHIIVFAILIIIAPAIVVKFWGCRRLEEGNKRDQIQKICDDAGIKIADIQVWPVFGGRMITAGVMGLISKFRYILVTPALLTSLSDDELKAVIVHETGHVKNKHLFYYLLVFVGFITVFLPLILNLLFYIIITFFSGEWLIEFFMSGNEDSLYYTSIFFVMILFFLYLRFFFGFYMRNFERQADVFVYKMMDNARPMIQTFIKISEMSRQPPDKPNWHHFSIAERVAYLYRCEYDREWIEKHNKKVKKMLSLFGIMMIAGMISLYYLESDKSTMNLPGIIFDKLLIDENLTGSGNNADILGVAGDFYYSKKKYEKTREFYEKSLTIKPDNPHVLNNLAWLYITCEEVELKNPERSLVLAEEAVALLRTSQILDTLAESYYQNGLKEQSIKTAKEALSLANENITYYNNQIRKFEEND